jgi:hypothetical protein
VHVLYGYDLYFRVSKLVYEEDIEGLQVQWIKKNQKIKSSTL